MKQHPTWVPGLGKSCIPEVAKHRAGDCLAVDLLHAAHHLVRGGNSVFAFKRERDGSPCTCELLERRRQLRKVRSLPRRPLRSPLSIVLGPATGAFQGYPFLLSVHLKSSAVHLHDPRQLGETKDFASRKIADGHVAHERHQVMLAQAVVIIKDILLSKLLSPEHLNVLHDHHFIGWLGENCVLKEIIGNRLIKMPS